jgi:hypothetical protein
MKVKELIDYLSKKDPSEEVFSIILTKAFVPISGDETLRDTDWLEILNVFRSENAEEDLSEAFSEAYNNVLRDYFCDNCCEYDYDTKNIGNEGNYCKHCGEEDEIS